jgi:hypothetical protein
VQQAKSDGSRATRRALSLAVAIAAVAAVAAGCGSDDDGETTQAEATEQTATAGDLAPIKEYLLDHAQNLVAQTGELQANGERYYDLAESVDFDYQRLLDEHRDEVGELVDEAQGVFREANPAYEEMEGIVAGVPELAEYDVIIDAGAPAADDPENAVPFDLELPDGTTLRQPGNFFFLTETALWGTNEEFVAKGVKPDLDGDGEIAFGEALPDADLYAAATSEFARYAEELQASAEEFEPTDADALGAVVIMTPTMSEYFEAWKNSRFIAGEGAEELGFVATSRLSDIADILEGLVFVYDGIEPVIAEADAQQAGQTGRSLAKLQGFAAELRDDEEQGRKFSAEEADLLGSEAQQRAEAIAGQVSQAAAKLDIELPEA